MPDVRRIFEKIRHFTSSILHPGPQPPAAVATEAPSRRFSIDVTSLKKPSRADSVVSEATFNNEVEDDDDVPSQEKMIHAAALAYVNQCPLHLYDLQNRKMIDRTELAERITTSVTSLMPITKLSSAPSEKEINSLVIYSGKYAILSHRWRNNELLFSDWPDLDAMRTLKPEAYQKFTGFCAAAQDFDCPYVWIDSMCIDRANDAEVHESIPSMFTWYRNSRVCIVYLGETDSFHSLDGPSDSWFHRGWTLQEFLAPLRLKFYYRNWEKIGHTRGFDIDRTLTPSRITLDETEAVLHERLSLFSVLPNHTIVSKLTPSLALAPEMFRSISRRKTLHPEDVAYCLMGLLDVALEPRYGEGAERAFYRLQMACLYKAQTTPDRDLASCYRLFHWVGYPCRWNPMLSRSPSGFEKMPIQRTPRASSSSEIRPNQIARIVLPTPGWRFAAPPKAAARTYFTDSGLHTMMWIFNFSSLPREADNLTPPKYICSLIDEDDTSFCGEDIHFRGDSTYEDDDGRVVVGIYAVDDLRTYGLLLKQRSEAPESNRLSFTRLGVKTCFLQLPSITSLLRSGARLQEVEIM